VERLLSMPTASKHKYLAAISKSERLPIEGEMLKKLPTAKKASYLLSLPEAERQVSILNALSDQEKGDYMTGKTRILGMDGTTATRYELEKGMGKEAVSNLLSALPRMEDLGQEVTP